MDALKLDDDQKWRLVMLGSAVAAAIAVRGGIRMAWSMARDEEPPMDPLRRDADWSDAVLFSLATGATVGLARMLARVIANETMERTDGRFLG